MKIIVPSVVVQTIETLYPWTVDQKDNQQSRRPINPSEKNILAAIADLADQVAPEFFIVSPEEYSKFLLARSVIRNQVIEWTTK